MTDLTLDCLGLKCPLPVLKARKRLAELAPGAALTVLADDPLAPLDLAHMAQEDGLAVERSVAANGQFTIVLRRPA